MARRAGSTPAATGAPFVAQVRRSGRLGLVEQGSPQDVPAELIRACAQLWPADLPGCAFYWQPVREAPCYRVTMNRHEDGALDYVLLTGEPVTELPHHLSMRELEVLTLLIAGLGNAEVAAQLWISERTAAVHVNHILQKLRARTRTAAATYALDAGLLHVPLPGTAAHYANLAAGPLLSRISPDADAHPAAAEPPRRARATRTDPRSRSPRRELVVGSVVPHAGKGSDDGREMLNGLELAMEEINAAGGIRGRTVRKVVIDIDVTTPSSVRPAFEALLRSGVDVVTSGYLAAQDVAHEIVGESGLPYLHAATSGVMERAVQRDLARFGRVFQVCASDTTYAPTFVSYLTSLRDRGQLPSSSRRLAVLEKGWEHVDFGVAEAEALAERNGWQLDRVPVAGPEDGDGWSRAVVTALRQPAAAVMIGSFLVDDTVQAVEALRRTRPETLAYAIYAPSVPSFRHALGEAADGVLWATMTGTYSDRNGVAFAQRYAQRFHVQPGRSQAGLAYDRMHRIALAWRLSDDLADPGEVATHLRSLPYRGVNGTYNFDTPGQTAQGFEGDAGDPSLAQPQLIYQIQHGSQVIVSGGPFTTGDFRPPGTPARISPAAPGAHA